MAQQPVRPSDAQTRAYGSGSARARHGPAASAAQRRAAAAAAGQQAGRRQAAGASSAAVGRAARQWQAGRPSAAASAGNWPRGVFQRITALFSYMKSGHKHV